MIVTLGGVAVMDAVAAEVVGAVEVVVSTGASTGTAEGIEEEGVVEEAVEGAVAILNHLGVENHLQEMKQGDLINP